MRRIACLIAAFALAGCAGNPPPPAPTPAGPKSGMYRVVVPLTLEERDQVLGEMRDFLVALQGVTEGLAQNDFAAVSAAARKVGSGGEGGRMPPEIARKLPPEFRQLARATHDQFDALAADATARRDARHTLAQTSALMQRCNACHALFRFPD